MMIKIWVSNILKEIAWKSFIRADGAKPSASTVLTAVLDLFFKHFLAINSLWPSYAIWWHRSGSTLAQVMACCLAAPSHYLNQCWLVISKVSWHSPQCTTIKYLWDTNMYNKNKNYIFKLPSRSPRGQWFNDVNCSTTSHMTFNQMTFFICRHITSL